MNAISNFGERVKACRNELGITQAELAELAGVKRNTVYMWESGTSKPWPKTVDKLAELFVVFPHWPEEQDRKGETCRGGKSHETSERKRGT